MSQPEKKRLINQPNVVAAGMGVNPMMGMNPIPQPNPGMAMSSPSPNIIQQLRGGNVLSNSLKQKYPEVEGAYAGRSLEFPEAASRVTNVNEMGPWGRFATGGAYGSTGILGNISLNMDAIKRDKQDVNDVLAHEMTHAGQGVSGFIRGMFGSQEPENKAINAEAFRKVRKGDIHLREPMTSTQAKIKALR